MVQLVELVQLAELGQRLAQLLTGCEALPNLPAVGSFREALSAEGVRWIGRLQLLVLQPSPFCNLDCRYCYLPDRGNRRRMDFDTLDAAARKVFAAELPGPELSVVWHAGEPLAVPKTWYEEAFARVAKYCPSSVRLTHHFQTNGVLIDDSWLAFFRDHEVRVGISVDGPAWLHDRHRRTRSGRGTHANVMSGVDVLRNAGFPFHAICVLTRESLDYPDEIFDFFADLGATQLGFNVEEIEAANASSSLAVDGADSERAFRSFMSRIVERRRHSTAGGLAGSDRRGVETTASGIAIREIDAVLEALRDPLFGRSIGNSQNLPGRILTVAWDGRFSTFSPELLGQSAPDIGELLLGNVVEDPLPPTEGANARYRREWKAVRTGIERCRDKCFYFDFCRGGAPSNKLGETGRFDGTDTLFCRLTQQILVDVVLAALDRELPLVG